MADNPVKSPDANVAAERKPLEQVKKPLAIPLPTADQQEYLTKLERNVGKYDGATVIGGQKHKTG